MRSGEASRHLTREISRSGRALLTRAARRLGHAEGRGASSTQGRIGIVVLGVDGLFGVELRCGAASRGANRGGVHWQSIEVLALNAEAKSGVRLDIHVVLFFPLAGEGK